MNTVSPPNQASVDTIANIPGCIFDPDIWGTVADWVSGIATIATVFIGVLTVVYANKQHLAEIRQHDEAARRDAETFEREKQERMRSESGRVFSWIQVETEFEGVRVAGIWLHITNQTEAPVYDWLVRLEGHHDTLSCINLGPALPGVLRFDVKNLLDSMLVARWAREGAPRTQIEFKASNGEHLMRDYGGRLIPCQ